MQICKRLIIFCFALFFSVQLFAQSVEDIDITGLWKGTMYNDTTQRFLKYEIAISKNKGKLTGYTHTYFIVDDKEYHGVKKVKIKIKDGEVIVEDDELIAHNYPVPPNKGVRQVDVLVLKIKESVMTLSGPFSTIRTKQFHSLTGNINVQRKNDFWQSALIPHLEELGLANNLSFVQEAKKIEIQTAANTNTVADIVKTQPAKTEAAPVIKTEAAVAKPKPAETVKTEPVKKESTPVKKTETPVVKPKPVEVVKTEPIKKEPAPENKPKPVEIVKTEPVKEKITEPVKIKQSNVTNAAADIGDRKIETIQSVYYKTDSLELTLYDNGEVDGDTVSVLMNGELIMPRVGLSTNAVRKKISTVNTGDSIQLIMYAENLGSLPPNTGLLIVYDGTDRYEIRFSGDLKKSAAIIFRRKEN